VSMLVVLVSGLDLEKIVARQFSCGYGTMARLVRSDGQIVRSSGAMDIVGR
jgi:hypothetical protein